MGFEAPKIRTDQQRSASPFTQLSLSHSPLPVTCHAVSDEFTAALPLSSPSLVVAGKTQHLRRQCRDAAGAAAVHPLLRLEVAFVASSRVKPPCATAWLPSPSSLSSQNMEQQRLFLSSQKQENIRIEISKLLLSIQIQHDASASPSPLYCPLFSAAPPLASTQPGLSVAAAPRSSVLYLKRFL